MDEQNALLEKNRYLEDEKCQLESENNALSEEKRQLNDQVMGKNREIERLNTNLRNSERNLSLLKLGSDEQIKLTNDKITEISKKNTALSEDVKKKNAALTKANNSLKIGNRLLKRFLNLNKAVGWRYALKSLFSRGISATRANIKALKLIRKQGSFDMVYYCESYKDVLERGIDPLIHFIWFGGYENRNPYKGFDVAWYLKNYSDVRKSKVNPYAHYVLWGKGEKRKTAGTVKKNAANVKKNAPVSKNNSQVKTKSNASNLTSTVIKNPESSIIIKNAQKNFNLKNFNYSLFADKLEMLHENLITIIVPIYNAYEETCECIESVIKNTVFPYKLMLIND
ncbi:MAG: hypothetical protein LIO69_01515 [Oscillospiraceae bacterium]|nr:hypothetical protein [Oscillospiraceae bacterium]